ncbi:DeoR/GlpR family DNA-binding transcription regulator [Allostreptomyces psammosilenae]|nr:DeoR/GlpR family DNA-binding transcription regulator [Allostreptomyces psammosilenae]
MLGEQRRALILAEVRRRGGVRVNELTRLLGVSDMTVRRDLDVLARQGMVAKVHGGAVPADSASGHEPGFEAKAAQQPLAKEAIARRAVELITPGSVVAMSGGTTVYALARRLTGVERLTVVTNSVRVAEVFHPPGTRAPDPSQGPTVVLTGGVRTPSDSLVGPIADLAIRSLNFDLLVMGTHGLSARRGLTTPNVAEADTNREFFQAARRVAVLADHSKWGVVGMCRFAGLEEVDVLVTDSGLDEAAREEAASVVGDLLIADV